MSKYTRKLIKIWILDIIDTLKSSGPDKLNYISYTTFSEIMEKELNLNYTEFKKRFPSISTKIHWVGIYPDYIEDSVYVSLKQLKQVAESL